MIKSLLVFVLDCKSIHVPVNAIRLSHAMPSPRNAFMSVFSEDVPPCFCARQLRGSWLSIRVRKGRLQNIFI